MNDAPSAFVPLRVQVAAKLRVRLATGDWKPGERLPSYVQLAAEYGVSAGLMQTALRALEADRLIVRRPGAATIVARHDRDDMRSRVGRLVGPDDAPLAPTSHVLESRIRRANREQAARLGLTAGTRLRAITRLRGLGGKAAIFERIFIPAHLVRGLPVVAGYPMSGELYAIYEEHFGITIARASDRLAAVTATAEEARHLGLAPGAPLLEITRVATDVIGWAVELRISRCDTARVRYAAEVV